MSFFDIFGGNIIETVGKVADELITTDEERLEKENEKLKTKLYYELENKRLDTSLMLAQADITKEEAKSHNWFIAGARPFIIWVCGIAIAYSFIIAPFLHSAFATFKINFPLPKIEIGVLFNLLLSMLGLAGLRTYEKLKGVNGNHS